MFRKYSSHSTLASAAAKTPAATEDAPAHSRRAFVAGGLAAAACAAAAPAPAAAATIGAARRVHLHNPRTEERFNAIYYAHGRYLPNAMRALDEFLRDWRTGESTRMDPRLIDIVSAAQFALRSSAPFSVISAYRSPRTNAALRRVSRGVAKNSYHMKGQAVDLRMEGVDVATLRNVGLWLECGGVGAYTSSNFVHLDSGPVRSWGA